MNKDIHIRVRQGAKTVVAKRERGREREREREKSTHGHTSKSSNSIALTANHPFSVPLPSSPSHLLLSILPHYPAKQHSQLTLQFNPLFPLSLTLTHSHTLFLNHYLTFICGLPSGLISCPLLSNSSSSSKRSLCNAVSKTVPLTNLWRKAFMSTVKCGSSRKGQRCVPLWKITRME